MSDGARLGRDDLHWLASLLLVGCLTLGAFALTAHRFTGGQGGVPLDDAWIHFQFARNLARGDGLSFNPGQPTSGSTAPLWTLLLAGVYLAGGRFPAAGQLLSGACFLAALVATYTLGLRLTGRRWAGWLAGAVVAVNGRMAWAGLSALETCLFAALGLLALIAHVRDRATGRYRLCTAALFGLAALSRPEGYLLFALSLADFITHRAPRTAHHAIRAILRQLPLLPVVLFTAIVLPYLIFSLCTSGHLLPNTYRAKAVLDFRPDLDFLSVAARYLILDNPLLLPFTVLGLGVLLCPAVSRPALSRSTGGAVSSPQRCASLLSLWSAGLPLVYAMLHTVLYQHGRYLIPLIPCNAVIGVVGLLEARRLLARRHWQAPHAGGATHLFLLRCVAPAPSISRRAPTRRVGSVTGRALALLVGLLVVAGTAWRLPTMASLYAWNMDNVNAMHVAIGHWVAEHTPPDAVLALNDIGAITYVSERPVVDLAGLVTPEVVPLLRAPDRDARLTEFMAQRDVGYVVIFPNWFPGLAARTDLLEPVHRVTLERNTIAGGETMVVYRAHWRR